MNKKLKKRIRIITIITTLLWMGVIFRFSMDTGVDSGEISGLATQVFNKIVYILTGRDLLNSLSFEHVRIIEIFIRKLAHMFIYFVLSINVMGILFTFNMKMKYRCVLALFICFLYACSDEVHQTFVPGRFGSFFDCIVDTTGAFIGILMALIIYCILYTIMTKYQKKKGTLVYKPESEII